MALGNAPGVGLISNDRRTQDGPAGAHSLFTFDYRAAVSRAMEPFMTKPKIEGRVSVTQDGPYAVTGNIPLAKQTIAANADGDSESWTEGHRFPARPKYSLCRCGQSSTKPFCDGTHTKVGFDGTETASREPYLNQATTLDGPVLALADAESLCAFGRFCDPNGKVWKSSRQHRRSAGARHVRPAGRRLPGRPASRMGQGVRPAHRTASTGFHRPD